MLKYLQSFIPSQYHRKDTIEYYCLCFPKQSFKRYKERNLERKRRFAKRERAKYGLAEELLHEAP